MANSEFSYVKSFELPDALPLSNWIVVRIDGRGFSKLCKKYNFIKPNDRRALDLMNSCAVQVVKSFHDIVLAYGQSDEYSFVFHESTTLFERRSAKLSTSVATMFTAEYCLQWGQFFPPLAPSSADADVDAAGGGGAGAEGKKTVMPLERPYPTFDGRCVCYPKQKILRDYLNWRQADCHINNLYNTTFWSLVLKGGMSGTEAELLLKGTMASDKNEILWARFGINYNEEPEIFRKGSVVYRAYDDEKEIEGEGNGEEGKGRKKKPAADPKSKTQLEKERKRRMKVRIAVEYVDIIGDAFWEKRPYILAAKRGEDFGE